MKRPVAKVLPDFLAEVVVIAAVLTAHSITDDHAGLKNTNDDTGSQMSPEWPHGGNHMPVLQRREQENCPPGLWHSATDVRRELQLQASDSGLAISRQKTSEREMAKARVCAGQDVTIWQSEDATARWLPFGT